MLIILVCLKFSKPPYLGGAGQQIQSRLIECPPPLVKGERFIRSEGRPEWNGLTVKGQWLISCGGCATLVGIHERMWQQYYY